MKSSKNEYENSMLKRYTSEMNNLLNHISTLPLDVDLETEERIISKLTILVSEAEQLKLQFEQLIENQSKLQTQKKFQKIKKERDSVNIINLLDPEYQDIDLPPVKKRKFNEVKKEDVDDKQIIIEYKRKNHESIKRIYGNYLMTYDITKGSTSTFSYLSPSYPHKKILIPGTNNKYASSVEGLYEGLKIFENDGIKIKCLINRKSQITKRYETEETGKFIGWRLGIDADEDCEIITEEVLARYHLYVKPYLNILKNDPQAQEEINNIKESMKRFPSFKFVLLINNKDFTYDWKDCSAPINHASIIRDYIKGIPIELPSKLNIKKDEQEDNINQREIQRAKKFIKKKKKKKKKKKEK
eukprot:TRINITY_DN5100_c0_g1_i1.p1 TRINITY_DN5100_c0_g1~~TRINITY_DN5100_c0_g1_i1.p1  ORF type:complete len:357 (-),score=117.82 TRINITY_DN5100_c0_g1_i1:162-1232(-)